MTVKEELLRSLLSEEWSGTPIGTMDKASCLAAMVNMLGCLTRAQQHIEKIESELNAHRAVNDLPQVRHGMYVGMLDEVGLRLEIRRLGLDVEDKDAPDPLCEKCGAAHPYRVCPTCNHEAD